MKPSLEHVRNRINGAGADFQNIKTEMLDWINSDREKLRFGLKPDTDPNAVLVFVLRAAHIEHRWSRRLAHVLYDCRSALDHLVWQLYVAANSKEPSVRLGRQLQFPLCTRKKAWDEELRRHRLQGIAPQHISMIQEHQPYKMRRYTEHAFTILARLTDTDKHREPNVLLVGGRHLRVQAVPINGSCEVLGVDQLHDLTRPLQVGAKLARIRMIPAGVGQPGVNVECVGSVSPAFDNGFLVEEAMNAVLAECSNIIGRFENLYPPIQRSRRRIPFRVPMAVVPTVTMTGGCGHWSVERITAERFTLVHRGYLGHEGYEEPTATFEANP